MISFAYIPIQFFLAVIYLQWILWILLYYHNIKIGENVYNVYRIFPFLLILSFAVCVYSEYIKFHIDAIQSHHLWTYSILLWICYVLLDKSKKFSYKDVICLTFLLVFINSEYWELPYRFLKIMNFGVDKNDILQLTHFIPLYFLKYSFIYERKNLKILVKGLIFLFVTLMIRLFVFQSMTIDYHIFYMIIQRIGALYYLTTFFIKSDRMITND